MKKRVLHVTGSLRMGGLETVALNYFKYIDKEKYEFDYLVYGNEVGELEKEVIKLGGRVLRIPATKKGFAKFYKNLKNILKEYGPYDIVHSHPLFNSGIVMKAAYAEGVRVRISHSHSARSNVKLPIIKNTYNAIMKILINKYSTHQLACSMKAGIYLFGSRKFKKNGIVIKNGIEITKYQFNPDIRKKIRQQLNLENKFVIGHVGRLSEVKNQDFILDVFRNIRKERKNTKLLLVGDGPTKTILEKKAVEIGIINDILFLGTRNDVNELLQAMDVFIFPSKYEGLGLAVIEAQATGLRCVVSDVLPNEVNISPLISRLPLNTERNNWIKEVMIDNEYDRKEAISYIKNYDYDLENVIEKLSYIYSG